MFIFSVCSFSNCNLHKCVEIVSLMLSLIVLIYLELRAASICEIFHLMINV